MGDKLWRCTSFFIRMLTDRGYTFPIRKFQTSLHSFQQLQAATKSLPMLLEHMRIHGTTSSASRQANAQSVKSSDDNDISSRASATGGKVSESNKFLVHFAASVCGAGGGAGAGGAGAGGAGAGGAGAGGGSVGGGRNGKRVTTSERPENGLVVSSGSQAADATERGSGGRSAAAAAGAPIRQNSCSRNGNGSGGNNSISSSSESSFGKQQAEVVLAYMRTNNITRLLLVAGSAVTAPAQKLLESAVHVEYWPIIACLSCAETHCTVPKCRRLTTREKKEFYAKHGIAATNLPRMLLADRMSRYWDFQVGDLVEFARLTHVGVVRGEVRVVTHA